MSFVPHPTRRRRLTATELAPYRSALDHPDAVLCGIVKKCDGSFEEILAFPARIAPKAIASWRGP